MLIESWATDESEIETTEFHRDDTGEFREDAIDATGDATGDALAARDTSDDILDHRAALAASWLVTATRAIESATDDLNAAIRAGARLPFFIADRVVIDGGEPNPGGFRVVSTAEFRLMANTAGRAIGGGL